MSAPAQEARDLLAEELRDWAKGSLPLMAAVDFVVGSGTALAPMVKSDIPGQGPYLDLFGLTEVEWDEHVGWMSSGERGTWELARSLVAGELGKWFWRMDGSRQAALISALIACRS